MGLTRFLGSEEVLKEVLEVALGRRGFTHERVEDMRSILHPGYLEIGGKPLDFREQEKWGKDGWERARDSARDTDGVGGIAGIWHSNHAGEWGLGSGGSTPSLLFFTGAEARAACQLEEPGGGCGAAAKKGALGRGIRWGAGKSRIRERL